MVKLMFYKVEVIISLIWPIRLTRDEKNVTSTTFIFRLIDSSPAMIKSRNNIQEVSHSGKQRGCKFLALLSKNWMVCKRHWTFLIFFATLPLVIKKMVTLSHCLIIGNIWQ